MVALVQDPMPDYIVIIPLLCGALFVLTLLAVGVARGGSRPRNTGSESRQEQAPRRWSSNDSIWLSSYLSDLERGQHHDRR